MKEYFGKLLAGVFLAAALTWLLPARGCLAAGLEQTGATEDSVTIRWDLRENARGYRVYAGTCSADARLYAVLDDSVMTARIGGLPGGSRSYIRVDYDYVDWNGEEKTGLAGYTADAKTLAGKVRNVRQTGWYARAGSAGLAWDRIDSADGYEYTVKNSRGQVTASGRTAGSAGAARLNRLPDSEIYTVSVRAFLEAGGRKYYGDWSDGCLVFAQPRVTKLEAADGKLKIKWRPIAGVSGYDVYVSAESGSGYKKVKSAPASAASARISSFRGKKISAGSAYYVYIAARKKAGGKVYRSGGYFYQCTKDKGVRYFRAPL